MKWNQFALFLRPLDVISGCVGPSCHQKREREGAAYLIWMQEGRRGSEFLSSCPRPPSPPHTTFPPVWNEKFINFITFRYGFNKLEYIVLQSWLNTAKNLYIIWLSMKSWILQIIQLSTDPLGASIFGIFKVRGKLKVLGCKLQTTAQCERGLFLFFCLNLKCWELCTWSRVISSSGPISANNARSWGD